MNEYQAVTVTTGHIRSSHNGTSKLSSLLLSRRMTKLDVDKNNPCEISTKFIVRRWYGVYVKNQALQITPAVQRQAQYPVGYRL
jgi:hypothetical protein